MQSFLLRTTLLALCLAGPTSCATLFGGTTADISVQSTPVGATYWIESAGGGAFATRGVEYARGVTPATVRLSKNNEYVLHIKAEGYEEAKVPIAHSVNPWLVCSAVCGLVPAAIDVFSGGMWNLEPGSLAITLVSAKDVAPARPKAEGATPPAQRSGRETASPRHVHLMLMMRGADGELRSMMVPLTPETT